MVKSSSDLEIAHVLFMDTVGYWKLPMAEQTQALAESPAAASTSRST